MKYYEVSAGENIHSASEAAIKLANKYGDRVSYTFNDIKLTAKMSSDAGDLAMIYYLQVQLRHEVEWRKGKIQ